MTPAEKIIKALTKALAEQGIEGVEATLERPADMAHGDYASNVALVAAKAAGKDPRSLAEAVAASIPNDDIIVAADAAGPGFINFRLAPSYFVENLKDIDEKYGRGDSLKKKTVLVEYTQPNVLKPFHIGHLMSNAIGESLSRVIENAGADVKRLNYQGDVGLHVAKALWGVRALGVSIDDINAIGTAYAHGAQAYEDNEKARGEIALLNEKIYQRDPEAMQFYEAGRTTSLAKFEELYATLGTTFDKYYFESEVWERGLELVEEGKKNGIFKESEGAIVFPGENYDLHTRVFVTSKGLPVYEAKELALAERKAKDFDFDISITETAVEQEQYFEVVFKALSLLRPEFEGSFTHVSHGMMQIAGGKMSSRLGNVITGESLLAAMIEEVEARTGNRVPADVQKEVARDVAVAAIKYAILRQAVRKNIIFDEERSLSFDGDSGPYLQYTTVRARSIVAKAKDAGVKASVKHAPEAIGIVEKLLERFPEVAARSAEDYEPHHIATYAIELASAFNAWYAGQKIVDESDPLSPYRVTVAEAVAVVLERALWLLGIRVPKAM